jgi:hypothetical protein
MPLSTYRVRIRRPVDSTEWGRPTRQRTRDTHYTPSLTAHASRRRQRWVRNSRFLRVIAAL